MATILIGRTLSSTTDSVTSKELNQLVPVEYDHLTLTYAAAPNEDDVTSVVYRSGGAGGTIVATLNVAYNAGRNISSVERV